MLDQGLTLGGWLPGRLGQLAQQAPEIASVLARGYDFIRHQQPAQIAIGQQVPDEREALGPRLGVQFQIFGQRQHAIVPGFSGHGPEMLAETPLTGGKVGKGQWQVQLASHAMAPVTQGVVRPVGIRRRVATQVQAIAQVGAPAGPVAEQRISARLHRQPGLGVTRIIGNAVLGLAGGVAVEYGRHPAVQALDEALDHVAGLADGALQHIAGAVSDGQQAHLLAQLLLAPGRCAEARHVGYLAEIARSAGLTAGIGIDLGIEHQHLDRFARHHQAREILEADVIHGPVTTNHHHRRAQRIFLVGKIAPVEVRQGLAVGRRSLLPGKFQLGRA